MKTIAAPRRHALRVIAHVVAALQVLPPGASWAQANTVAVREPNGRVVEREGQARRLAERIERERRAQTAAEAARIAADPNAPKNQRPIIGVAANGVPVVLIAAPAANGVSHNRFSEFNVGTSGLVLNNSGGNTQTQIAGWVQGNPFLGNNSARIILNEVSGALPTSLRGQIEVAGRAADVIIANPNGIACDGCGFINTPRATLTTGTPVVAQDGVLVGFAVQRGAVSFNGQGLDARNVDQLDILAHSVQANAEVWANKLNVVTGANQVDYTNGTVTAQSSNATLAPVSLDVSQLGGMYANTVRLIGTQQGLGVNSQGTIAALGGELEITQAGDIRLSGRTQASGATTIKGADVHNSGALVAGSGLGINGTAVRNDGSAVSGTDLIVNAQVIDGSGTFAAGIDASGNASQNGSLRLTATHAITLQGARLIAGGDVQATGAAVTARDGSAFGRNIRFSGNQGLTLSGSDISATDTATLGTLSTLNTDGASVEASRLVLQARSLSNRGGTLTQTGNSALAIEAADGIDNRDGTIAANATDLTLRGIRLDNAGGDVRHAGNGTLRIDAQTVDNNGGSLLGNGAIRLDAATLANRGGSISAQGALGITTAGLLDNTDGLIASRDALAITSRGNLDNSGGAIRSASSTAAARVQADGTLTNASRGGIAAEINANAALAVTAGTLVNDNSRITTGQALVVTTGAIRNSGSAARVLAETDLTLNVTSLDNSNGAVIDARIGNATVTASGAVSNSGANSAIQSAATTTINATGITNSGLVTGATTTLEAGSSLLRNEQGGRIGASTALTVNGSGIVNNAALLQSGGTLAADARSGTLANNASGTTGGIVAGGALTVLGQSLDNRGGMIDGRGAVTLNTPGVLDNQSGVISGGGVVNVTAHAALDNRGGAIQSASTTDSVTVRTDGALDNSAANGQAGEISANAGLSVNAGSVTNTNGRIAARNLTVASGAMSSDGSAARLLADEGLTLDVARLTQGAGSIIDGRSVTITTRGGGVSNAGTIQSGGSTRIAANGLTNTGLVTGQNTELDARSASLRNEAGGRIGASAALTASGAGLVNDAALMRAGGELTLDARGGTLANTNSGSSGGLVADDAVTLRGGALDNSAGYVEAGSALAVPSDTTTTLSIDNRAGTLYSRGRATLIAGSLDNTGGRVEALGDVTITAAGDQVHNTSTATQTSRIASGGTLVVTAASLDNRAAGAAAPNAADVGLTGANVEATVTGTLDNRGGFMRAADTLTASAALLDNRGGTVAAGNPAEPIQADGLRALGTVRIERTAVLNNGQDGTNAGLLYATRLLDIDVGTLQGSGSLSSRGDLTLNVQGAHDNSHGISAERHATLTTAGTLTNRARIEAGGVLAINAPDIVNTASGEIVATDTRVAATGNLTNHGLIDGTRVLVSAGNTLTNHGRLYGDELALRAGTLTNHNAIAARWSLDIGASTLVNNFGAELFSLGGLYIGGTLDANRQAAGSATSVTNNGARIEALGNLHIDAGAINNLNVGYRTELQTTGTETVALNNVPGTATWLADSEVAFQDKPPRYTKRPNFDALERNDETFALHVYLGDPADKLVFGVGRRRPVYAAAYDAERCDFEGSNCVTENVPAQYLIGRDDPLWAAAQVAAPAAGAAQAQVDAAYATLQGKVDAFNAQWTWFNEWTHIAGTKTTQETVVVGGQAGQILAGGNITLRGAVDNRISRIVAGGALDVSGASVANTGAQGVLIERTVGTSIYTRIDRDTIGDDDRLFNRTAYDSGELTTTLNNVGAAAPQELRTGSSADIDLTNQADPKAGVHGAGASRAAAQGVLDQARGSVVQGVQAARGAVSAAAGQPTAPAETPVARISVSAPQGTTRITTQLPAITLPTSSLFSVSNAPGRNILIETDPRFTQYRVWASSDTLLAQLNADPQTTLRRLGDGFYEQRLVTEQIMAATGQRYIGGYGDSEAQYLALLNAGAEFAQTHRLTIGVALTEAQMRLLTTDMVWLVAQNVTLPDGTVERVLAPQVYVRVAEGDLRADGTLMAGSSVTMQLQGDLTNSGAILGRQVTDIRAENIGNSGRIGSAGRTELIARQDITSSGAIDGDETKLRAERDVNLTTQTSSSIGPNASRTAVDRVASVNASQLLEVSAGRDITLAGAQVSSAGELKLDAKRDLNLATVNVADSLNLTWDPRNRLSTSTTAEIGSTVRAQGDITLKAGQDVSARAAYVSSDAGALSVTADRDITITAGQATSSSQEDRYTEKNSSGFGPKGSLLSRQTDSSRSTETHSASSNTQVQASTFSADSVTMSAGRDLTVKGSNVAATNDVSLSAARDLTLTSAEQTSSTSQSKDEQRRGLGAMGGISNGSKNVEQANTQSSTQQVGSQIGSLAGNVTLTAGNDYRQTASDVRALQGDVTISGANVTIDAANNTSTASQDLRMRQSGASVTFSSPIVNALQGMVQTIDAAGQTNDSRTQALAAASTVMAAANLASTVATASALNISVSVGNSRSQSHSEQAGSMAATSSVEAGGDLTIKATGKQPGQGNLTAIGANLSAGGNATLDATNDIDLRAAQNSVTQSSTNQSSSASIGVGFALGGTQNGITINAAASQARGNANGTDVTNTLTTVSAGNALTLNSGRDTNLIGAVASGNSVTATVGGNLDLQSVQDTSTYASRQQSAGVGVSICVYPLCVGASSASVSASSGRVNGDFASVTTQSALRAGDGGFQVNVNGNTNLTGAAITSSQSAVDAGKNSLATNTLTQSEIANRDSHNANSVAVSASYSSSRSEYNPDTDQTQTARNADGSLSRASNSQGIGVGSASGSQRSTTGNAISGATMTIKSGDSTALASIDRTTVTEISSANALTRSWDGQQLAQNTQLQAQLVQSVGSSAARLIGDYAGAQANSLRAQAREAGDPAQAQNLRDEAAKWDEGGIYRVALHTGLGALTGGVDGALGAGTAAAAAPVIDRLQGSVQDQLQQAGMSPDAAKVVATVIGTGTATAVGAAAGGNASAAAAAFNVDANNRQLHPSEIQWIARNARGFARQLSEQLGRDVSEVEAMQWLTAAGQSNVDEAAQRSNGNFVRGPGFGEEAQAYDAAKAFIVGNTRGGGFTDERGLTLPLFTTRNGDFYRPEVYGQYRNDANYREYFWQVQGVNLRPDNPTPQEQQRYDERQAQLNSQIPKDLLLIAGPAAVTAAAGRIASRPAAGTRSVADTDGAPSAAPHAPVGDEPLPNVHVNQRQQQQTPEQTWQQLQGRVDQTRRDLDGVLPDPGKLGNVGVAEIQVNGQPPSVVRAHSQIGNNAQGELEGFVGLPPEGQRILRPLESLTGPPRQYDTEYKILENFAQQNRGNASVEGRIDLFTERPPCNSCTDVIRDQFNSLFPNMTVRVYHSDGQITTYQNGVPTTITAPGNNPNGWPKVPAGGKTPG